MTIDRFAWNTALARAVLLGTALVAIYRPVFSQGYLPAGSEAFWQKTLEIPVCRVEQGALIRAEVTQRVNWSRVPKGSLLEARLSFPLYAGEQVGLPAGTPLRIIVDSSERVREHLGFWRKTGRAIVRAFNPLEKNQTPEYAVTMSSAELLLPSGQWAPIDASVVRAGSAVILGPHENRDASGRSEALAQEQAPRAKNKSAQVLLLQLSKEIPLPPALGAMALQSPFAPAGRRARAYLLNRLSASQSREGDKFQAQLAEPVRFGDLAFGPGSLLEGTVVRRTPPRILSRTGKLYLRVDRVTAQNGHTLHVSGTLSRAEADAQTPFVLDEEGTLRGRKRGIANGLVDLGISYALGKLSDDLAETPIRALGASMSDAAVANAARYVGLGVALAFLVRRHGRDVRLPKYAEVEIDFGRAAPAVVPSAAIP